MSEKFCGISAQLGLGIALGVAVLGSSWLVTKTLWDIKAIQRSIDVKGQAECQIISENGVWNGKLSVRSDSLSQGYKDMEESRKKALAFIEQEGFKPEYISVKNINKKIIYKKSPDGKSQTNDIEKYVLTQKLEVTSQDVEKISKLPEKMDILNTQGCDIVSESPRFFYPSDKLDQLKVDLLAKATQSAYQRAKQFALNSGSQVGRLLSARQGVFQVTAPNKGDTSDYGVYDTSSIEKVVKVVVTLSYGTSE